MGGGDDLRTIRSKRKDLAIISQHVQHCPAYVQDPCSICSRPMAECSGELGNIARLLREVSVIAKMFCELRIIIPGSKSSFSPKSGGVRSRLSTGGKSAMS